MCEPLPGLGWASGATLLHCCNTPPQPPHPTPPALAALCDLIYSWTVPVRFLSFQLLLSMSGLSWLFGQLLAGY